MHSNRGVSDQVRMTLRGGMVSVIVGNRQGPGVELRVDGQAIDLFDRPGAVIQADRLLNVNQLATADLSSLDAFVLHADGNTGLGLNLDPRWTCEAGNTAYVGSSDETAAAEVVYVDPAEGELLPVIPDMLHQARVYCAVHRCWAELVLQFFDENRVKVGEARDTIQTVMGGRALSDYRLAVVTASPPERSAFVRLSLRKLPLAPENYMFFLCPWLGCVSSRAVTEWAPAPCGPDEMSFLRSCVGRGKELSLALPPFCFDGRPHEISVVDRATGRSVLGSPCSFTGTTEVTGRISGLDGTTVVGSATALLSDAAIPLRLVIDGTVVAHGLAGERHTNGHYGFRLPIPPDWCDGLPHRIAVEASEAGTLVGEIADFIPAFATPWHALQRFAGSALPATAAPAVGHRYQAMREWLNALSAAAPDAQGRLMQAMSQLGRLHEVLVQGFENRRHFPAFALPDPTAAPLVSIIVPAHDKAAVTYHCLAALAFYYNRASFEVILVDDGSSDETTSFGAIIANLVVIRNAVAQGFIRACNRAAEAARGQFVVMLNNDTEPTSRWLDELLQTFELFDDVGLAGSKLLMADGRLQEAGGIIWNTGNPSNYGRGANPRAPKFNYTRQVDYVSGAAIMLPRSVWQAVGGFGEEYCPAYFEDADLACKVRGQGLRTVYAPLSVVYHFEGMSHGTSTTSGVKRYQEINRPTFRRKWAAEFAAHGDERKNIDLMKDRFVSRRALVVDVQSPRPDNDAGSYAAIQEMRLLQALGFKLSFLPLNFAYSGAYTERLQRMGVEVCYAPFTTSVEDLLAERGSEFDLVYITRYYVAQQVIDAVRRLAPRAKVLFCNADLHFLRELRDALADGSDEGIKKALATRDAELRVMQQVDVTLSYNTTEHAVILSHNLDATRVATCPWVVDVADDVAGFDERADLAYLGGFDHKPNRAAVQFMVNKVMPLLRKRLPGVRFRVFGSNIPEEIRALAGEDVVIEGYVEDVRAVYDRCRVFVAPLLSGAGIKGKVIDALAHGTPAVLSPIAAEGTAVRGDIDAIVAETPEEWAAGVERLYGDRTAWESMSRHAREQAKACYSLERGCDLMRKALELADLYLPRESRALVARRARF